VEERKDELSWCARNIRNEREERNDSRGACEEDGEELKADETFSENAKRFRRMEEA
jgi:hypothetical protein